MTESFDAVLAEMRGLCKTYDAIGGGHAAQPIRDFANRLQAAHEREAGELQDRLDRSEIDARDYRHLSIGSAKRADAAVALLRECGEVLEAMAHGPAIEGSLRDRIDAFLAHGGRTEVIQ